MVHRTHTGAGKKANVETNNRKANEALRAEAGIGNQDSRQREYSQLLNFWSPVLYREHGIGCGTANSVLSRKAPPYSDRTRSTTPQAGSPLGDRATADSFAAGFSSGLRVMEIRTAVLPLATSPSGFCGRPSREFSVSGRPRPVRRSGKADIARLQSSVPHRLVDNQLSIFR